MKKSILVTLAVFTTLFLIITFLKNRPETEASTPEDSAYTDMEKEKVTRFWVLYRKGTDYRMNGQWQEAAESYRQSLAINGRHEDALYYLGNMYLELSRYPEAEECWQKLIEVNPKNSRAYQQLSGLYLSSEAFFDIDKAENACLESLKINKEETGPLLLLGEVHLIRGQLEDAAAAFEAVSASNYKSTEAYFLGGYVAWKKGDLPKARELFVQAVNHAKPLDNKPQQVEGEGDTRKGKGFGAVASKSVFRDLMTGLPSVQPANTEKALTKAYTSLDALLVTLKRRVH